MTWLRCYRDFDKLNRRNFLSKCQPFVFNQSRRYQSVCLAARNESKFISRYANLTKLSELLLRRTYCTKPTKEIDRGLYSIRRQHRESKKEIKRLFSLAKDEKWYLIAAVGCLIVSSAVTLGVPRAIGKLMDMIVMDDFPKDKLHAFCIALFGIFVIGGLANFGRIYLMNSASKGICICVKKKTIKNSIYIYSYL